LAQVNVAGVTPKLVIAQLSKLPALSCAGVTEAFPDASRLTETFWQIMVGAMRSTTVTVAVQEAVLPWPSLTVSVTTFAPKLPQEKELGATDTWLTMPQLSAPLWNTL